MSDEEKSQGEAAAALAEGEGGEAAEASKKTTSNPDNPFDMGGGLDFEAVKRRNELAKEEARAKEAEKQNQDDDIKVIKIGSLFDDDPLPVVKDTPKKSSAAAARSAQAQEESSSEEDSEDEEERRLAEIAERKRREREANTIHVGEKTLSKWPWDHYHMVQEEYWRRYYEREEQARLKRQQAEDSDSSTSVSISSSDEDEDFSSSESGSDDSSSSEESSSSSDSENSETSSQRMERKAAARRAKKREERRQRRKQEKKRLKRLNRDTAKEQEKRRKLRQRGMEEEREAGLHDLKSDILVFERPQDPPELAQAVKDLNLTEFEAVAKERAITMISTWLFDAGLVQELMATKKVSKDGKAAEEEEENKKKKVKIEIVKKEGKKKEAKLDLGPKKSKMDIEIEKLEKAARSQLELITMRLNKAVTASGNEVQDLVNSVINTKGELVRLRKTSSMINEAAGKGVDGVAGMAASQTTFAINKYPHLKYAINARKNLAKCFRELTFFSQIPEKCANLSDMLNSAEWSEKEWTTLRTVCREHVQLEIFLVEAQAGMRKQQQEEEDADDDDDDNKRKRRSSMGAGISRKAFDVGLPHNNDEVDRFLKEHVQTVVDLGNEIRLKMFSGIAGAFGLSVNSPESVVAIVESIEIYESANQDYQSVHGADGGRGAPTSLRFKNIRSVALAELYKDMQEQGNELFEKHTGAIEEDDENYQNKMFSGILLAANELSSEVGFVAEHMAPCFPPDWSIEVIWTACVATICAEKILTTIGGSSGEKLPLFGTQQLLQLVAWVENFRDTIEESFPEIGALASSERTYFDKFPTLLANDGRTVNIAGAKDCLAFYSNNLWDAHDSGKVEFIFRTKESAEELLKRTYMSEDHEKRQLSDGTLTTSLVGDVYGYIAFVLKTLRERLTRKSEAMIQLVGIVFKALYEAQLAYRDHFLVDFECCCAGANDFVQMSDKCEDIVDEIRQECTLNDKANEALDQVSGALLGLYTSDAVHAAQKVSVYIFQDIADAEEITPLFFTVEWLDEMPDNELAGQVAITIEDYMKDLEQYLDPIMLQKAIQALVTRFVNYYIELLLQRATSHKSNRDSHFADNRRALDRMQGDIGLIKELFQDLAGEDNRPMQDAIENEFEFFETIHEIMTYAAGLSDDDIRDYIYAFQTRIKKFDITYAVIGDLYHLVSPSAEKEVYEVIDGMSEDLKSLEDNSTPDKVTLHAMVPGLSLDDLLKQHVEETKGKRNRPGEGGGVTGLFSGFMGGGK